MRTLTKSVASLAVAGVMLATAPLARAVDLTVTHWGVLMYGVPFAVAQAKGYFKDEGVDVTGFITSEGGGTTLRNALAADTPYGEVSLNAVVAASQQGVPLTIVHGGVQSIGDILWVTRKDADGINKIEDLKGKAVGYTSPRSVSQSVLLLAMNAAGIGPNDFDGKALGGIGAGLTALDEKAVDAATILEPIWTKVKAKYKPVFRPGEMLPSITQTVGVVRTDFLKDHGDLIRGIIAARQKGVEFIYAHPEEAGQILAKAYNLDPAIAVEAVQNVAAIKYWSPGSMDRESMTNMVKAMQLVGATPEGPFDWSGLIDESYLPESLRSK